MLWQQSLQLGAPGHAKIGKIEARRDRTAAQGKAVRAGQHSRGLQLVLLHDVLRALTPLERRTEPHLAVLPRRIEAMKLERVAQVVVPDLV